MDDYQTSHEYDQFQNDIDLSVNRQEGDDKSDALSDQIEESPFEDSDDGFGSDTEIDLLISQGKL